MQYARFRCPDPRCRVTLIVPRQMQGRPVRCGACGQVFMAPVRSLRMRPERKSKASAA